MYRLTEADYSTGEAYQYAYDPVGNRLKQIIDGDTTDYLYDAANRLEQVNGQTTHTYDANGNLLSTEVLTNVFDTANRLVETSRAGTTVEPLYDGLGHRVAQTKGATTTTFALDVGVGLPEVIYTSEDTAYLHLPGVIMTENISGEIRYLLSDGLGSVRHAVDENSLMVAYHEYDPYGNPTDAGPLTTDYGYTGEWWQDEVELLHLRARWYLPEEGVFLSRDPVESEPPYQYVGGNPINRTDPSGLFSPEVIRDSLVTSGGYGLRHHFLDRPGLLYLLLAAQDGDIIDPLVADFGEPDTFWGGTAIRYPLRRPRLNTSAVVSCANGNITLFTNNQELSIPEYLQRIELSAMNEVGIQREWRDKTTRLHYYMLTKAHGGGYAYYDDLANGAYLPDVIGGSVGVMLMGRSSSTGVYVDRFGQTFVSIGVARGIPQLNAGNLLKKVTRFARTFIFGGGGYRQEGYYHTHLIGPNSRGGLPSDSELAETLTDFPKGGAFTYGGYRWEGVDRFANRINWFSQGGAFVPGTGAYLGAIFGPFHNDKDMAWDWVDGKMSIFQSYSNESISKIDQFADDPYASLRGNHVKECGCERRAGQPFWSTLNQ